MKRFLAIAILTLLAVRFIIAFIEAPEDRRRKEVGLPPVRSSAMKATGLLMLWLGQLLALLVLLS